MPITAAKGQINIILEALANQGMTPLLTNAAAAASMSLTTQPVTSQNAGSRLVVWVLSAPTSGSTPTITIAGTDINGNAQTEGPINVALASPAAQSSVVGKWEYETTKVFKTVNSNGITTTNLSGTGALITVSGAQGAKYLAPGVLKAKKKFDKFSPDEHRNLLDRDTKRMQTLNKVTLDELSQVVYPENSLWVAYMITSSASTVTTLPASPTSLLASTAVSGSPLSLTTQPSAPGMFLIFAFTGTTVAGTVAISGTNQFGVSTSETVTIPANNSGNYYSANCYSAVAASGLTITGLTAGSITVTGVYGWQYVFLPGDTVYSACIEAYTGVDSFSLPWTMLEEASFEFGLDKEFKLSTKGICQDRLVIGDRTASSLNANRITALGQPGDLPMVGWQSLVYIDTTSGAAPTTTFGDLLEGKIQLKSPQKPGWTATNSQNYNRVNRGKRQTSFDAKIDLTNVLQWEQHRLNTLQYITFQMLGAAIGGGNNKKWEFTFPARWDDFDISSAPNMEHVEASVQATAEYDSGLGGAYRLTIVNQQPPTYAS
ncbi:MAG TPA: hypothetical protein VFN23_04385 [Ktedonobacteraceae bacterium]|nr:hypothetical protein [Ktedonobacteraceae bacterium]